MTSMVADNPTSHYRTRLSAIERRSRGFLHKVFGSKGLPINQEVIALDAVERLAHRFFFEKPVSSARIDNAKRLLGEIEGMKAHFISLTEEIELLGGKVSTGGETLELHRFVEQDKQIQSSKNGDIEELVIESIAHNRSYQEKRYDLKDQVIALTRLELRRLGLVRAIQSRLDQMSIELTLTDPEKAELQEAFEETYPFENYATSDGEEVGEDSSDLDDFLRMLPQEDDIS